MFIKHGVINSQNIDTIINESQKNKANQNISNLDVLFKNSHILDMLMREVTLHDSINNSSSIHTDKFSWNQQDDQEDENYINFLEMMDDMDQKLVIHSDDDEKNSVRKVSTGKEKIIETKSNIKNNFKHKYLKTNKKKNTEKDKNLNQKEYMSNYKEIYDIHQDHIKIIQKNVRGWLLRRQYLDIKYAARVLQNCNY